MPSEFTAENLAERLPVEICHMDRITPRRDDEAVDQMCASRLAQGLHPALDRKGRAQ